VSRTISAAAQQWLDNSRMRTAHLVDIHSVQGIARATDWATHLDWNGNTYLSLGHVLGFSDITETGDIEISPVQISLSGIDQAYVALALRSQIVQQPVLIYKAVLDNEHRLLADPVLIFKGRMDGAVISEDPDAGTSTVSVTAWPAFAEITVKRGRFTTDPMEQALFPGDTIFAFASDAPKDLFWGRPST
jgi:hypothetical protein